MISAHVNSPGILLCVTMDSMNGFIVDCSRLVFTVFRKTTADLDYVKNYIIRSYKYVIRVTRNVTRRTNKAKVITL